MATATGDVQEVSALSDVRKCLVLGYYDRWNIGDEQYKTSIPLYFGAAFSFDFVSIDDLEASGRNLSDYDMVVCGGGDIINPYFMDTAERILSKYTGPTYAFSVGIPFDEDAAYIDLFDHVVVRSEYDYNMIAKRLGSANVTLLPDVAFLIRNHSPITNTLPDTTKVTFGVCIAAPILINAPECTKQLASAISMFLHSLPNSECHMFFFNTDPLNYNESDIQGSILLFENMDKPSRDACVVRNDLIGVEDVLHGMSKMQFNVCMRYHSAVFSMIANVPLIAIVATKKMYHLVVDRGLSNEYIIDVNDARLMEALAGVMMKRMMDKETVLAPDPGRYQGNQLLREAIGDRKYRQLLVQLPTRTYKTLQETVVACIDLLNAFYGFEYVDMDMVLKKGPFELVGNDPVRLARIICFAITGDYENACMWGLSENMRNEDFVLFDAIDYVFNDMQTRLLESGQDLATESESYYPMVTLENRPMVSIDPFLDANIRNNVHRSGWTFVVNHMMNYQASYFRRPASLIVDTYVERTFHWGFDSLMLSGLLPYTSPWIGFIHHTYETTHSTYNCEQLFQNDMFLESLSHCKSLIVLSEYLAKKIRVSLKECNHEDVPVLVIIHPTEFVDSNKQFTMTKFITGEKKVVQIGAWLRNSYSIFSLPLLRDKLNPIGISKAALVGNNMGGYYIDRDQFDRIINAIDNNDTLVKQIYTCDEHACIDGSLLINRNKFIGGLMCALICDYNSVEIINKLSNDEFDDLLASNMVFLDLVDGSAVNTVLECIVRNTVIIVNRQPALEEILGSMYPGFYDTLVEATAILGDLDKLNACYIWLTNLDKSPLRIETFVESFADIVANIS